MRATAIGCTLVAIACEIFAWWGLHTQAGNHAFDEMAGIVPFAAGVAGVVPAAIAAFAWWRVARNRATRV